MNHPERPHAELCAELTSPDDLKNPQTSLVESSTDKNTAEIKADSNLSMWFSWADAHYNLPIGINRFRLFLAVIVACYLVGFTTGFLYICYRRLYDLPNFFGWVWQYGNLYAGYSLCGGILALGLLYLTARSKVRSWHKLLAVLAMSPVIVTTLCLSAYMRSWWTEESWIVFGQAFFLIGLVGLGSCIGSATAIYVVLRTSRSSSGVSTTSISSGSNTNG